MRRACFVFVLAIMLAGCRREPADENAAGTHGTSATSAPVRSTSPESPATAPAGPDRPQAMDAHDESGAPQAIPHSNQLSDWVKVHAVRVRSPEKVAEIVEDERILALCPLFPLNRVARTVYRKNDTLADVVYIEAQTAADAYGFYSVATKSQGAFSRADGSVRTEEPLNPGDPRDIGRLQAAWQGDACILVRCHPADPANADELESCEAVLSKIVFEIPSSDPPLLLFAVPADYRDRSDFWCVRTTRALPMEAHPTLAEVPPEEMDRRLGLNGHVLLHLASVEVGENEQDNLIWVAEYPQPQAASEAYLRYMTAIEANGMSLDTHTLVVEPAGRLMAGSWTAGQESIQRLLPRLKEMILDTGN
jgi:hypothetical protein